jgi:glycosyltransferase involved in cell wall biosynthesis
MPRQLTGQPRRVLMTVDAVGGVWRYAVGLGAALREAGVETVFAGLGPAPSARQQAEAEAIGRLLWFDLPLDWIVEEEGALNAIPTAIAGLVKAHEIDLVHLNLPSQAAGLDLPLPVIVVSHSCVPSWFRAVRGSDVPPGWAWQKRRNAAGLANADLVLVPTRSHGAALEACYGPLGHLRVVGNATTMPDPVAKAEIILAAGRWWDEGKNGAVLDAAAGELDWPVLMAGATDGPNGQRFAIRKAQALGPLPGSQMAQLTAEAAIVVSPSIYEPFGLVALEGAAAGAALVLADIPTYRELWDGAAVFVSPHDPAAWSRTLNALSRDEPRRRNLGEAARDRARRFTFARQRDAMLAAYATAFQRQTRLVA